MLCVVRVFLTFLLLALSLLFFRADFSRLLSHFYPIPWRPFRVASKPFPAPWDLHCYTTQKLIIQPHSDFKMHNGTNFSFPLLEIHTVSDPCRIFIALSFHK